MLYQGLESLECFIGYFKITNFKKQCLTIYYKSITQFLKCYRFYLKFGKKKVLSQIKPTYLTNLLFILLT